MILNMKYTFPLVMALTLALATDSHGHQDDTRDHVYKKTEQRDLNLWLYPPADWKAEDKRPAVLLFHGGGWGKGTPEKLEIQAKRLRDLGLYAIGVEYRLTEEEGVTADLAVEDARSAMRYVKANADSFGIDPDKIVALGGSAGGHLALCLSMADEVNAPEDDLSIDPAPVATVALNPVVDTTPPDGYGTRVFANKKRAEMCSPTDLVQADLPPLIIMHGDKDKSIRIGRVRALRDAMTKAGNKVVLHEYPGAGHGFFNIERKSKPYRSGTLSQIEDFLRELGLVPQAAASDLPSSE